MGSKISRRARLIIVAAGVLAGSVLSGVVWPLAGLFASEPTIARASQNNHLPGTFIPTKEEWVGLKIEPVETRQFRPECVTEGNVALDDDLNTAVFSPYSGRVIKLIADLGAHVERGAPLFAVQASEFVQGANTLITAVAADKTARSQLAQAEVNEKRAHELYLSNGGALKDWQQSRTDLATAQNAVGSADIALAAARNQLQILGKSQAEIAALEAQPTQQLDPISVVTAPITGMVTQRQVGLGQYIQSVSAGASSPIYTIGDLSKVYLIANVREADAGAIHVGEPVEVAVPAYPSRVFNATLSWVSPAIDPNTHRLPVRAVIDNPDGALKPSMFADFTIVTGEVRVAPAVLQSAVVYEGDQARVWLVVDGDTLALREIHTGQKTGEMVEVISGLAVGDKVVTRGAIFIDRAGGTS